ncbi:hypothetical protein [Rhodohalobacter sp. 614A]|uniref:hypothetical protein n=1 Tax=Rhodohalobacter sp. 614A TaxID=2908649 RepID=UPI001F2FC7A6|nr:hypothetical protein [Rhodohalobacter sp. 614A]
MKLNTNLLRAKVLTMQGTAQSDLKVPYADVAKVSDSILFNDHTNPSKKLYIPQYDFEVHRISGNQQLRIELEEATDGEGGSLNVLLKTIPPEELKNRLNGALPMDHKTAISLLFTVPGTSIEKKLPFTEVLNTEHGFDATLRVSTFNEFSQVCAAISDSEYGCRMEIARTVSVATPMYSGAGKNTADPKPVLHFTKKENTNIRGTNFTRIHLSIRNWDAFSDGLFSASPELPPCGRNTRASRTWVDIFDDEGQKLYGYCGFGKNENLQNFSFARRAGQPLPATCYVVLWDRKTNKKFVSNKVNLQGNPNSSPLKPGEKIYSVSTQTLKQNQPFHFKESQHPYIYRNTGDRDLVAGGYKPFRIQWDNDESEHIYLQEEVNPKKFLYLPDSFRLAKEESPPFSPKFHVKMAGRTLDDLTAEISYQLEAFTDSERLETALAQLKNHEDVEEKEITFSPLVLSGEQLEYKLFLPEASGFKSREESLVTLENIQDTLPPISLEAFESVFDTVIKDSSVSNILTGHVEVTLPGISIPSIPVSIRLGQPDVEMLAVDNAKNSNFQLEVKNVTSRTLSAQGVVVTIQDGENTFTGSKAGIQLPLKLASGESITFSVIPDVEIEKPEEAIVALTWEGMQQHNDDGSVSNTAGSFSIVNQQMGEGDTIVVTNLLESTIKLDGVNGFVESGEREVPLIIKNLSIPIIVPPGESFSFDAIASEDVGPYELSDLSFNWRGLKTEPDKGQLFDAIVDTTVQATYESTVKVSLFIAPISNDSEIRLLKIEFKNAENGPLIEELIFTGTDFQDTETEIVEKQVNLPLPIKDFILGSESSGQYWFRIILIKKTDGSGDSAGSAPVIGAWQNKAGSLEITSSLLPI